MYQLLMRVNRYFGIITASILLISLAFPQVQQFLGLGELSNLAIFSALLAGSVLADKRLAKLSFNEVCEELAGVSLEEATEKFWKDEQERRRNEHNRR